MNILNKQGCATFYQKQLKTGFREFEYCQK